MTDRVLPWSLVAVLGVALVAVVVVLADLVAAVDDLIEQTAA